jgi:hypothetical protein
VFRLVKIKSDYLNLSPARLARVCGALILGACLTATLGVSSAAAAGPCENEAIREQQSSQALPECRAYEMVSPNGSTPMLIRPIDVAAVNGDRFGYYSWNPYPGQGSQSTELLSIRTPGVGWSAQSATPPQGGRSEYQYAECVPSVYYAADLTAAVLTDGFNGGAKGVCDGDEPPLVAGEPRGVANLFLWSPETGGYRLIESLPVGGATPENAFLIDATPDLSHLVFSERAPLTPEAAVGGVPDLYEWFAGATRLISLLPGETTGSEGELADGSVERQDTADLTHALSADGERAFFYGPGKAALYVRINAMQEQSKLVAGLCVEAAKACTVQVDTPEKGLGGTGGGGVFLYANADGERAFFMDEIKLTSGSTAVTGKPDLYEYDVATGKLADLTVDAGEPADVLGGVGASEDGSYVYFIARGVLTGTQKNSAGAMAVAGGENLYVRHEGVSRFIATLIPGEYGESLTQVSPNGLFVAFDSQAHLTEAVSGPAEAGDCGGGPCREVFRYDASAGELVCVSCVAGVKPTGPAEIRQSEPAMEGLGPALLSRNVLDDGRVFFDTRSPLAPGLSGKVENVYEYHDGEVSLISTGTSAENSEFLDATPDGSNVFFSTDQSLVASDTDELDSVYDARVNGGFPAPPGVQGTSGECGGAEACRAPPSGAPVRSFDASKIFSGPGNLTFSETVSKGLTGGEGKGKGKRALTRAQKLKRALKACGRVPKRRRAACRRLARKRFGPLGKRHGKRGGRR